MNIDMNKLMREVIENYDLSEDERFDEVWSAMETFAPKIEKEHAENDYDLDTMLLSYHACMSNAEANQKNNNMKHAAMLMLCAMYKREAIRGMLK